MAFPIYPWHHGGVPDINDTLSSDIWLSQNISLKIKSDHHLTTQQLQDWIPQEYRVMANRKYIETVMLGILDHTIGVREYVETKTLNLKTRKLEFQLEFAEEDFIETNFNDSIILEGSFFDIHTRYFKQNPDSFVFDHHVEDFDVKVANILVMSIKCSTIENIVGFYVEPVVTHLISISNLAGPSLFNRMYNKEKNKYRSVSSRHTIHMLRNMISALHHLHSKFLVHTNVTPTNFHFQRDNAIDLVLIGLESCKTLLPFETLNDHGDLSKFTVKYLSPARVCELEAPDSGDYTDLADMWSVGIIAIELLSGLPAYGFGTTDEEILQKIRSDQFPEIPSLQKHDLADLLKGLLHKESTRFTATECMHHILFDLKRIANLDVPLFLVNALTCSNIDQYKGVLRLAIATRVDVLSIDIQRQMGSFFGVRLEREITLLNIEDVLCEHSNPEIIDKLKKTMQVFEKSGKFILFNMLECICFSQCKHMNRLKFVHDILSEFEDDVITKQQLREWMHETEIPDIMEEPIFESMNFEIITKADFLNVISSFLMSGITDDDEVRAVSTEQAFQLASAHTDNADLTNLVDAAMIKSHRAATFRRNVTNSSDSLSGLSDAFLDAIE